MTGATASVVAFFAGESSDASRIDRRPVLGSFATAMGIALIWAIAHQSVRGFDAWPAALWPPDVTERFPALLVFGMLAGLAAWFAQGIRAPLGRIVGILVRLGAMGTIAVALTESMRRNGAGTVPVALSCAAIALIGAAWWWAIERAGDRGSGILLLTTLAVIVVGFGIVAGAYQAYSLGYVCAIGGPILLAAAWCVVRYPDLARGPVIGSTIASALIVVIASAYLYAPVRAIAPLPFVIIAPACVLISSIPRFAQMNRAERWSTQLGMTGAVLFAGILASIGVWTAEFGED